MESERRAKTWSERVAEKAEARAEDERRLSAGEISRADLARENGPIKGGRYRGPSKRIQRLVASEPDIRGGMLCIAGTRCGVHEIVDLVLVDGIEGVLAEFPTLTREQVEAAVSHAHANPVRDLRLDLRDIAIWLDYKLPGQLDGIVVDRNYSEPPAVLSHVVTFSGDDETRRALRAEAERILVALGYAIAPTGGDTHDVHPDSIAGLTDYERVLVLDRMEAGLADGHFPRAIGGSRGRIGRGVQLDVDDDF